MRLRTTILSFWLILSLLVAGCGHSAQYYSERGNRFYAEGKYADASLNYRQSLKSDPKSAEIRYRLGLAELKLGYGNEAYQEFRRAAELAPDRDDIKVQISDLALKFYDADRTKPKALYDQIAHTADALLKKDARSFDGLRLEGDVQCIDGKWDEAIATFQKANEVRPGDPQLVWPLAQALFRRNRTAEAEALSRDFLQTHKDFGLIYDLLVNHYVREKRLPEAEALLKSKIANMPKQARPILQLAGFYQKFERKQEMSQTLESIRGNHRDFPQGRALVGDFYAGAGNWADALHEYAEGLRASGKDRLLYQKKMVNALVALGKRDEALATLGQALAESPNDLDARAARAMLLGQTGDPKKVDLALSELKAVVEKNPGDQTLHYNLGLMYLSKGDLQTAHAQFLESSRLARNYIAPRLALAQLAQKTRNYAEMMRFSDEVLEIDPGNADAKLWRCSGLIGNGSFQQARTELNALGREYPRSTNVNLHLAVLDAVEKKYHEAESRYLALYQPGQKDPRPLEGLIQVYLEQGKNDRALSLLGGEVGRDPDSKPARLLLAAAAVRTGKLDLAIQQYEWLRSHEPESAEAQASLGDIYRLRGDMASALASYEKARALAPNDPKIIAVLAYLQTQAGQNKEAVQNLQKQLAVKPDDAVAMNNLAFALAEEGNELDQAMSLVEKAQRKLPNNPDVADTMGWVYAKKGLNDSAIQIFSGLVKKYPDEPALRYHFGVALLQKGKVPEAKAELVIGLSKKPSKDLAGRMKEIVEKIG